MNYIDKISHTTVGKILKENSLKPHLVEEWCIPKEQSADFAACMEDVLEVYSRPYDERFPVVCMDEKPLQLLADARQGRRKKNGALIQDSEYVRNGTCSIFLFTEPLAGFRHAKALEHRTKIDWAKQMKWLADEVYPNAEKIIMVCDNLNTHDKSSFYETFPPAEALRLAKRFEFHYTPKHGSWLDIAEIELSALSKQCLGKRRIDNLEDLNSELEKWHTDRNAMQKGVDWQFTTDDARIKLKHLYPIVTFQTLQTTSISGAFTLAATKLNIEENASLTVAKNTTVTVVGTAAADGAVIEVDILGSLTNNGTLKGATGKEFIDIKVGKAVTSGKHAASLTNGSTGTIAETGKAATVKNYGTVTLHQNGNAYVTVNNQTNAVLNGNPK